MTARKADNTSALKPSQIAAYLDVLWQKFVKQKGELKGLQSFDVFISNVVATCRNKTQLDLYLGSRKTIADYPILVSEYSDKNNLPPDHVRFGSAQLIKWICSSCRYNWNASPNQRTRGRGCPACAGRAVKPDKSNSLAYAHPELAEEYMEDNGLPADEIVAGTNKMLHWKCRRCGHVWRARGCTRVRGNGCPACVNLVIKPDRSNSLSYMHPDLLKDFSKDNTVLPDEIGASSTLIKIKWGCHRCGHVWVCNVHDRVRGGCRACSNRIIKPDGSNSLARMYPELLKEYASENLLPANQMVAGSHNKIIWKCATCNFIWETRIRHRTVNESGCPACANRAIKPDKSNSLAHTHPILAIEYAEDNDVPADQVVAGTNKKLKWVCCACGNKWESTGNNRINGNGCPLCAKKKRRKT
jgi:rubrerythrin